MANFEEFKKFIQDKPYLKDKVKKGTTTWQDLFERYDLYGESDEIFKKEEVKEEEIKEEPNQDNENKEDMLDVQEELEDRFSDIPKSVDTLLKIAYIKTLCKKLKIEKIRQIKDEILLVPTTKYKTKEKIGYKIVDELEILLENMWNLKK